MPEAWMVYHQNPDYSSHAEMPKAVFSNKADANAYAMAQGGYGLGFDWFVKPVDFDPVIPLPKVETVVYYEVRRQTDEYHSEVIARFKDKGKAEKLASQGSGWYGAPNSVTKQVIELS